MSDDAREICRQARPDRTVEARVLESVTLRAEPDSTAPAAGSVEKDSVVTVLECVVGAPVLESRIWLRITTSPTTATRSAYILADRVVRSEPQELPPGGGPARPIGSEPPRPASSPTLAQPQDQPFDSRAVPGQAAPSGQGSLNRP